MRKSLVLFLAALLLFALALPGCGAKGEGDTNQPAAGFVGLWAVEGADYAAPLEISKAGQGYHLEWNMADGSKYFGKGLEVSDVLGAVFDMGEGNSAGTVVYKRAGKGLTGLWAAAGGEEIHYEKTKNAPKLTASKANLEGSYAVEGTNPDGSAYTNQLNLLRTGETWAAQWVSNDGSEVYGSGIVVDDVLVLGFGNEAGEGVAVYEIDGSKLEGIWLFTDYASLSSNAPISAGTEKAVRK